MGGMQEMMKAMMGNNVSDEEMAEMQSACFFSFVLFSLTSSSSTDTQTWRCSIVTFCNSLCSFC